MPQTFGAPPMSSAPPPAAYLGDSMLPPPSGGPAAGPPSPLGGRVSPELLQGLPPEFVQLLEQHAQFVDIDGDGTPDIAVMPLNQTGNALMRGPGGQRNMNALMAGGRPAAPGGAAAPGGQPIAEYTRLRGNV